MTEREGVADVVALLNVEEDLPFDDDGGMVGDEGVVEGVEGVDGSDDVEDVCLGGSSVELPCVGEAGGLDGGAEDGGGGSSEVVGGGGAFSVWV